MDPAAEDCAQSDVDPEMIVLTPEDITEQALDVSDEVETLRNRYFFLISCVRRFALQCCCV